MLIKSFEQDDTVFNDNGFIEAEKREAVSGRVEAISPIIVSADFFCSKFVFNAHRENLFDRFTNWLNVLNHNKIKIMTIWFGGSFIENKQEPSDIDGLLFYISDEGPGKAQYLQTEYCKKEYGVDIRAISVRQNPVDIIHQVAQHTLYYSQPSYVKYGSTEPFKRRAIISVLGPELMQWSNLKTVCEK